MGDDSQMKETRKFHLLRPCQLEGSYLGENSFKQPQNVLFSSEVFNETWLLRAQVAVQSDLAPEAGRPLTSQNVKTPSQHSPPLLLCSLFPTTQSRKILWERDENDGDHDCLTPFWRILNPWQRWMFETGPIFVFLRLQPLARFLGSLRDGVYSRHKCTVPLGPSASGVMKYCPLSTVFKPALDHSVDNFWMSDSCSNCCSYSCNRFPRRCSSVWGSATRGSVGISVDLRGCTWEYYPPEFRLHANDAIQFLEMVFLRIPFNFIHPSCVWVTTHFAQTKYWVGEDVDFGSSDLINSFAQ